MNRAVMYFAAVALIVIAAGLLLIGLCFLIVSAKHPGDLPAAMAMLLGGGGLLVWALRRVAALNAAAPPNVDTSVGELAARSGGEITVAEVVGQLGIGEAEARGSLARLTQHGVCREDLRGSATYFVFSGLKQVMKIKKCAYCGNQYPVATPGRQCPSCGGSLEIVDQE